MGLGKHFLGVPFWRLFSSLSRITTVVFMVEKNTLPEANIVFENGWLEDNQSSFLGGSKRELGGLTLTTWMSHL